MTIKNVLMIDVDLPVFPGGPASEFFGMVYLGKLCQKIGLVSQIHSVEQNHKKQSLSDQGIQLYLWQSDHLWEIPPIGDGKKPPFIRRLGKFAADLWRTGWWRPADTLIQDYQFRNIAVPITKALEEIPWDAIIVIQSSCARYIDFLPHAPVTALVMHDIRSLVYERRSQIAKTFTDWLSAKAEALRYRAFEKKYCHCYDLVITVSEVD